MCEKYEITKHDILLYKRLITEFKIFVCSILFNWLNWLNQLHKIVFVYFIEWWKMKWSGDKKNGNHWIVAKNIYGWLPPNNVMPIKIKWNTQTHKTSFTFAHKSHTSVFVLLDRFFIYIEQHKQKQNKTKNMMLTK